MRLPPQARPIVNLRRPACHAAGRTPEKAVVAGYSQDQCISIFAECGLTLGARKDAAAFQFCQAEYRRCRSGPG